MNRFHLERLAVFVLSAVITVLAFFAYTAISRAQDIDPAPTVWAGTPGLDETAPPVTVAPVEIEPTAAIPPVTVNVEIDPGNSPNVSTEVFTWRDALITGALLVGLALLRQNAQTFARSVPGTTGLTWLANYKDVIPGSWDDAALNVALRLGQMKLRQRADGWWEAVPKDSPAD